MSHVLLSVQVSKRKLSVLSRFWNRQSPIIRLQLAEFKFTKSIALIFPVFLTRRDDCYDVFLLNKSCILTQG